MTAQALHLHEQAGVYHSLLTPAWHAKLPPTTTPAWHAKLPPTTYCSYSLTGGHRSKAKQVAATAIAPTARHEPPAACGEPASCGASEATLAGSPLAVGGHASYLLLLLLLLLLLIR